MTHGWEEIWTLINYTILIIVKSFFFMAKNGFCFWQGAQERSYVTRLRCSARLGWPAAVREGSPCYSSEDTAKRARNLLFVLANQLTVRRFLVGINYEDRKCENSRTVRDRKVGQWPRCVPFFSKQGPENLNLLLLEGDITRQQRLSIGLERPYSQSSRCVTPFKDLDSSPWRSQAK